jgi:hypothetical protein
MQDSFIFYRSFYESIQCLPENEQIKIYTAIMEYAINGVETESTGAAKALFLAFKPQIDVNNKRRENGKKGADFGHLGGKPQKENPKETPSEPLNNPKGTPNVNVNSNDNVNLNVNVNENVFIPPTLEEISAYCSERKNGINPEKFIDYYRTNGWKVGKDAMKSWKAAVRYWENREKEKTEEKYNQSKNNKPSSFELDDFFSKNLSKSMKLGKYAEPASN